MGSNNNVKWSTHGQTFKTYQPGGADPNKFTEKYSNPGSYQGRRKREAEAEPQYFATQFVDPMSCQGLLPRGAHDLLCPDCAPGVLRPGRPPTAGLLHPDHLRCRPHVLQLWQILQQQHWWQG